MANELQAHQSVVHIFEAWPGEFDHVHLKPFGCEVFLKRGNQLRWLVMIKRAVKQIYSDYTQRLLLIDIRLIEHSDMDDDLARFPARPGLKPHSEPAVRFVVFLETSGRDGVRENKKRPLVSEFFAQPLHQ